MYNKINRSVASKCKPCGKEEKNMLTKHKEKKVYIVASGWNSVVRKVIENTIMFWRCLKHQMCLSFYKVGSRLRL